MLLTSKALCSLDALFGEDTGRFVASGQQA